MTHHAIALSLLASCLTATPALAASLSTPFNSNNGANGGNMFDVGAANSLQITGFRFNLETTNPVTMAVYSTPTTYLGKEGAAGSWSLLDTLTINGGGQDNPSDLFTLTTPLAINGGETIGLYITQDPSFQTTTRYTNGTGVGNVAASDANLTIYEGAGMNGQFDGAPFTPRVFNGTIFYLLALQNDESFRQSVQSAGIAQFAGDELTNLILNGAHHRILMDFPELDGENSYWVTGDFARGGADKNADFSLGEVGVSRDFLSNQLRAGMAFGYGHLNQELAFNGDSETSGQYLLGEVDYKPANQNLIYSLLLTYGLWEADLERGYLAAGSLDKSFADVDSTTFAARLRVDHPDFATWKKVSYSAFGSLTLKHVSVDGYNETGGGFPASFSGRSDSVFELRAGLTGDYEINARNTLRGSLEAVHLFSDDRSNVAGNVPGLFAFSQNGRGMRQNWARAGAELTTLLGDGVLSTALFVASDGEDPDLTASVRYGFRF